MKMKMKMNRVASVVGLALGLSLAAGPSYSVDLWAFQDDDIDFLLDQNFNLQAPGGSDHTIDVNDILVSVFEFPTFTIDGHNAIPSGKEVTGITATQVVTKDANGDGTENDWKFGAVTGGLGTVLDKILGVGASSRLDNHAGDGSLVAMWINAAPSTPPGPGGDRDLQLDAAALPATNCGSLTDCVDQATLGGLLQVDGFRGDPDEFWTATILPLGGGLSGDDIDDVRALGIGTNVAIANVGLSTFYNTREPVLFQDVFQNVCAGAKLGDADGCVNFRGFSTIVGGTGLSNGAFAHSDANSTKFIPEPTSLALLAVGLLGLGTRFQRRKG